MQFRCRASAEDGRRNILGLTSAYLDRVFASGLHLYGLFILGSRNEGVASLRQYATRITFFGNRSGLEINCRQKDLQFNVKQGPNLLRQVSMQFPAFCIGAPPMH